MPTPSKSETTVGVAYGLAAYLFWGGAPLFWKLLQGVDPWQLVAHRILWAAVAFLALVAWRGQGRALRQALARPSTRWPLVVSATLLSINWFTFVYAVVTDRVLHASLGYFINPIFSVLLGALVLRERLSRPQWIAVGLATAGIVIRATAVDGLPWISLVLAGSFGAYGLVRKRSAAAPLPGSAAETVFVLPVVLAFLVWTATDPSAAWGTSWARNGLLAASGIITAAPLYWFTNAAKRVRLTTLGFLQYVAPTGQLVLAVAVFGEALTTRGLVGFALVWAALVVFTADAFRAARERA